MRLVLILFLWTLAWTFPCISGAESLSDSRLQLEEIEKRIQETAGSLDRKKAAGKSLQGELQAVEEEAAKLKRRVKELEKESSDLREKQKAQEREVEKLQETIARSEGLVRRRLAALYKTGEVGTLRVLFSGASPARMAEDYDFMGRIVRRDRELLDNFRHQVKELEEGRRQLAALRQQQEGALAQLRNEQKTLQLAVRLKNDLLAKIEREESALAAELEDLRDRARRLGTLIKQLESVKPPKYTQKDDMGAPFARQKGRLSWPVKGPVRVGFGKSLNNTLGTLRDSQGIEIAAPAQEAVRAVGSGSVIFAKWFKGFGNMLILDHGHGYYSLYAQADRLTRKTGDQVQAGDPLAVSGSDGIYFEIRHHGSPLDPAEWLAPR